LSGGAESPDLEEVVAAGGDALRAAKTLDELKDLESEILGKRSRLAALSQELRSLEPEQRKSRGQALNDARTRLQDVLALHRSELEDEARRRRVEAERLDLSETLPGRGRGHLGIVTQTQDRLEDVFVGMGFEVAEGPEVETDWYNFTALNLPPAHPARSTQDSLYLEWGEPESTLLRTQTSPVQIRLMQSKPPPIYAVMPGRVYRRDTPDARHNPTFWQIEGLVVDRDIRFSDLAGTIEAFTSAYFGPNIHSRLRPYYFPFTEPSAEFEITCSVCEGKGCRTCSNTGWIELGGCGMVHPKVFENVGIDPEEWSGFAFGFGVDRQALVRHTIPDMRVLFDNDIRFIEQF
jgi:phenylalanyl-tRNA synthetase alpha chain